MKQIIIVNIIIKKIKFDYVLRIIRMYKGFIINEK